MATANVKLQSCAGKVPSWTNSCLQRFFYTLNVVDFVNGAGDPSSAKRAAQRETSYGKAKQKQAKHAANRVRYGFCDAFCYIRALKE